MKKILAIWGILAFLSIPFFGLSQSAQAEMKMQ